MEKYLGSDIPKLGFGLMRLPMINDDFDIEQIKKMVDMFLERGFTYFDTAYGYNNGGSERTIKTALVDRYPREKFQLATKLPAWLGAKTKEEAEQMFYTSLERTGAGYFDYYLLHNLGEERTHYFDDYDLWNFVAERKKEGLIRHVGISFHDKADVLEPILQAHPEIEFVQLQINYADWENPAVQSRLCYETARKYNKPVIIMEPVKGGTLASPPPAIEKLFKENAPDASCASWALRFAASLDGLVTVLSGMSTLEQLDDNTSFMADFKPLTDGEQDVIKEAQKILSDIPIIPCTACHYCVSGCPKNISIAEIFSAKNVLTIYEGSYDFAKHSYWWNTEGRGFGNAAACIGCGKCEKVCPQHIKIREELKKAAEAFAD